MYAQEIKFIDAYGKPLDNRIVIIYGKETDTVSTNKRGTIYLKRKKYFDSISVFRNNNTLETKYKYELTENIFKLSSSLVNPLPVFEANALKYSQLNIALKEILHESISSDDIYSSNVSTAAEMLLLTDGVTIQQSQAGGGSPIIRGFEANRILLMVDGVRMNNAIYRSGHLQNSLTVDPFAIENCDVIYGSSAVSYGSDAIGGVIHYKTKNPNLAEKNEEKNISTNYFNRYNSGTQEISNHVNFNLGYEKFASFSSITYKQFGNIKMGRKRSHGYENWGKVFHHVLTNNGNDSLIENLTPTIQNNVGYEQLDITQKILYQPMDNLSFVLNSQLSNSSNISRFDQLNNLTLGVPEFSEWYYGPQKRLMNSLEIKSSLNLKFIDNITAIISNQNIEESRITRKFKSNFKNINLENVRVLGASIQAIKNLGAYSKITYGTEIYNNIVESTGSSLNINTGQNNNINSRYPDGGSSMILSGYYAICNIQKNKYSINTGLRYSINEIRGAFNDSSVQLIFPEIELKNSSLNGSFNLSYYPHQKTKLTFDLSSGFKSPNIDDIGKIFVKDEFITVPNNKLIPEHSYCISTGWDQQFNLLKNKLTFQLSNSFYSTLLNNVIIKDVFELNGDSEIFYNNRDYFVIANQNSGSALVYGLNSSLDITFLKAFNLHSGICYTKGLLTNEETPLGHIPPLTGRFTFKYSTSNWNFSFFTVFNGAKYIEEFGPGNVDNPNEANAFGYTSWLTLNTKVQYIINKELTVNIGCFNISDIHYKTFASGISAPGRSLMISIKLNY